MKNSCLCSSQGSVIDGPLRDVFSNSDAATPVTAVAASAIPDRQSSTRSLSDQQLILPYPDAKDGRQFP